MYQILSQSVRFCRLYIKNILVFFSVNSIAMLTYSTSWCILSLKNPSFYVHHSTHVTHQRQELKLRLTARWVATTDLCPEPYLES